MSRSSAVNAEAAEQAVLGAMLLSSDAISVAAASLAETDFSRTEHRVIWRAILELSGKHLPCDAVTLGDWFAVNGLADSMGGCSYAIELANNTPSAARVGAYAEIVRVSSVRRRAIEIYRLAAIEAETESDLTAALSTNTRRVDALLSALSDDSLAPCRMPEPEENLLGADEVLPGLDAGTVGLMVGAGGVGKTMWSLQIVAAVATGKGIGLGGDGCWMAPHAGRVAMVCGEDPAWRISGRLQAIRRTMTAQDAEVFRTYASVYSGVSEDMRAVTQHRGEIQPGPFFPRLRALAQGRRLLILDPFAYLHDLPENDNAQMAQVIRLFSRVAAETGCAILLLHHSSAASESARGATAIRYGARVGYVIRALGEEEPTPKEGGRREDWAVFRVVKENNGTSREAIWLRRGQDGLLQRASPSRRVGDVACISARAKARMGVVHDIY